MQKRGVMPPGATRRGTRLSSLQSTISEEQEQARRESERIKLVLGKHIKQTARGFSIGSIAYYEPSIYQSQYENTLIYGPQGSGKTWVGEALAQQSFFGERRTWIIIDTKNSFAGNWRPNLESAEKIMEFGFVPMGIPGQLMDVISPEYFIKQKSRRDIEESHITRSYKIPFALCGLNLMFELTKLTKKASYASTFDIKFNDLLVKTNNKPTVAEFEAMIDDMKTDIKFPKQLVWVYDMMIGKIKDIAKFTLDEKEQWSPVGKCLFQAAKEGMPRWIVFTLKFAKNAQDDVNLAMVTAVLTEIKLFAEIARMNNLDIRLGVMLDELHTFVRDKDSSTIQMIHDLIFQWGRTSKLWRIYMTQKQEQLPKTFQDSIEHLKLQGTFQNIISCQAVPTPGYGKLLDRLHSRDETSPTDDTPRFYDKIKFMPPWCEVESRYPTDETWMQHWKSVFTGIPEKNLRQKRDDWDTIVKEIASGRRGGHQTPQAQIQRAQLQRVQTRQCVAPESNPRDLSVGGTDDIWSNVYSMLRRRAMTED